METVQLFRTDGVEITCPLKWHEAVTLAQENGDESLMLCFWRLMCWCNTQPEVKIVIGSDYEPYSFSFAQVNEATGYTGICGGIIYHGAPAKIHRDHNGGGVLEVEGGWHIHT